MRVKLKPMNVKAKADDWDGQEVLPLDEAKAQIKLLEDRLTPLGYEKHSSLRYGNTLVDFKYPMKGEDYYVIYVYLNAKREASKSHWKFKADGSCESNMAVPFTKYELKILDDLDYKLEPKAPWDKFEQSIDDWFAEGEDNSGI